jgi:hypothetical protein
MKIRVLFVAALFGNIKLATKYGLYPRTSAGIVLIDSGKHVAVIGNCKRGHAAGDRFGHQILDTRIAIQKRVLGMDVKVNKWSHRAFASPVIFIAEFYQFPGKRGDGKKK